MQISDIKDIADGVYPVPFLNTNLAVIRALLSQMTPRQLVAQHFETADSVTALTGATWTNWGMAVPFTIGAAQTVEVAVSGALSIQRPATAVNGDCGARLVFDVGAAGQVTRHFAGAFKDQSTSGATFSNLLTGAGTVAVSGLAAGLHAVQLQIYSAEGANLVFQPVTYPNSYAFELDVWAT